MRRREFIWSQVILLRSGYCQGVSADGVKVAMMAAESLSRTWIFFGAISMREVCSAE